MEKILFITQLLPYPPHSGGKYKTFHILKLLRQKYDIHVFCFYDNRDDAQYIKELEKKLSITVIAIYHPLVTSRHTAIKWKYLASLFSYKPFSIYKYFSQSLAEKLKKNAVLHKYSLIYCDHETSFQYINIFDHDIPVIYDEHNLHSVNYQRNAAHQKNILKNSAYLYEAWKHYKWESSLFKLVKKIMAISESDAHQIRRRTTTPVAILPTPFQTKNLFNFPRQKRILFVGLLSWPANKQGLLWFIHSVFPLLLKLSSDIELVVAGANADQEIINECAQDQIHLVGEVDSLDKYYRNANVVIAPILTGSGVRIKILHALAAGIPVVSTKLGREGIEGEKIGIIEAVTPLAFAQAIYQLCYNQTLAYKLSTQALAYMRKRHSHAKVADLLHENITTLLSK